MSTQENAFAAAAESLEKVRNLVIDGHAVTGRMASLADQAERAAARMDAQLAERLVQFDGQVKVLLSKQQEACSAVDTIAVSGAAQIAAAATRGQEALEKLLRAFDTNAASSAERIGAVSSSLEVAAAASSMRLGAAATEAVAQIKSTVDEFNLAAAAQSERSQQFTNEVKSSVRDLKKAHNDSIAVRQEIATFSKEIRDLGTKLAARQLAMVVAVGGLCVLTLVAIVLQIVVIVSR